MNPYPAPPSFQPNPIPSPLPSTSTVLPTSPYPHPVPLAVPVPAQPIQHNVLHQSHVTTDPTLIENGTCPSAEQHIAVAVLREIPNPTIFAWLKGFRSFLRSEQWFSHQQYQAISTLKDCPDDLISIWLTLARSPGPLHASQTLHNNDTLSNGRVVVNSFGQLPSSFSDPSIRNMPKGPWDQESCNLSEGAIVGQQNSSATTSSYHDHWCFICKDHGPIRTCDGFKRHIREHEKRYYCVPRESVLVTEDGPICAFCGSSNPDLKHLNKHSVPSCVNKKYTRKKSLIKHLEKNHGVDDGSVLAKKSEYTVNKKYFACGFCVSWFSSLQEQVNHIDAHYMSSKHIRDWDFDKVIRGLLSQPIVIDHWKSAIAANPHLQEAWFTWDPTLAKELQHRLEKSQEPADVLSAAAIDQSNYGSSDVGFAGLHAYTTQSMHEFQHQDSWLLLPSSSDQDSAAHTHVLPTTTSTVQPQQLAWNGIDLEKSTWNRIYGSRPIPQAASESYESSTSMTQEHCGHLGPPHFSPDSSQSFLQQQHPALVSSTASVIGAAQAWEGQVESVHSSRVGGPSHGATPYHAINLGSSQATEARRYPAQSHTGGLHHTLGIQSAPMPCNRPISRSSQVTSPFSPTDRQDFAAKIQAHDLMDYHGIDPDVDINNTQRIIHGQYRDRPQERPL